MVEEWKTIEGFEDYEISNFGRVKSYKKGKEKILKSAKSKNGYLKVSLCKNGKIKYLLVHRLVAQAFLPNPNHLPEINHKDEDKTNNRVENLEWCTKQYNLNYGTHNERSGKTRKGIKFSQETIEKMSKAHKGRKHSQESILKRSIPIVQLTKDGEYISTYQSAMQVERDLGFNNRNINSCCKGKLKTAYNFKWQYLSE